MTETKEAVILQFPERNPDHNHRPQNLCKQGLAQVIDINRSVHDPIRQLHQLLPELYVGDVMKCLSRIANDENSQAATEAAASVVRFIHKTKRETGKKPSVDELKNFLGYE